MEHHSATPAPAGLVSFAVACLSFFGIYSGYVDGAAALPLLACWMLGAFIIQIVTALRELDHGNVLGGNIFLYFSGFFCLATATSLVTKVIFPGVLGIALDARIEGFGWLVCTSSLILWTPAYFKSSNGHMGLLVAITDVALVFLTLKDLGLVSGAFVNAMIAWPLLIAGSIGIYVAAAIQLNTAFGRTVFKILPPLIKTKTEEEVAS